MLNEQELINLGFEIIRWEEPNYYIGTDRFCKLDYAILKINKDSGFSDNICIRFREGKYVLDGFYSVRFYTVADVEELIKAFTKISAKKNKNRKYEKLLTLHINRNKLLANLNIQHRL